MKMENTLYLQLGKIKIADPKKPKKDNKKIIKSQDVESVPAGEAAPGGPGPM